MTVAKLPRVNEYQGAAGPMAFPIKFQFLTTSDVVVVLRDPLGGEIVPRAGTYTVVGGDGSSGEVLFTVSTAGYTVVIRGRTEISQKTQYPYGTNFPSASHERAVDRAAMIDQEQQDQIDDTQQRAFMVPAGYAVSDILPKPESVIGFDAYMRPVARPVGSFPAGPPGRSNNTHDTIAKIAASPTSSGSAILAPTAGSGLTGATYTWKDGDYSGRNDVIASTWFDPVIGGVVPISQGAWVLPDANAIVYQQSAGVSDVGASPIYPVNLALRETTSLERWYRPGDGSWYAASRKASIEAATTGLPIKMRNRDYTGARIEVHRTMNVEGNGARVDYAGVGNTPVAGIGSGSGAQFSPWPTSDTDAMADRYPVTMYSVLSINADQMLLDSVDGLYVGQYLVLNQDPAPNSSPFNLIAQNYDKIHIKAISGNTIQFQGRLRRSYNNTARVFACGGYAIGCTVSDLTLTTNYDAYQFVIRNAFDCVFENITGEGDAAMGAQTFSFDTTIRDMSVKGGYGSWSTARCCDRVTIDGFTWQPRVAAPTPEPYGLFFEESPGLVVARRISLLGGGILIGSIQNPLAQGKRKIIINGFDVDVTTAPRAGHPLAIASVQGVSVDIDGGSFRGDVIQPDTGNFPNTPPCMIPIASNMAGDTVRIRNADFISRNAGSSVELGGGFQGRAMISTKSNTFATCDKPKLIARDDRSLQGVATIAGGIADVPFASILPAAYSIALTPNAAVQVYYNNEGQNGFRINAPSAPDGTKVSWVASEIPA